MDLTPIPFHWLWLPLAVAQSLISAQNVELNRRFKQEGFRLNLWRTLFSGLFWLPIALLFGIWPEDGMFYAAAMFSGVGMIIGFTIQSDLAAKHNGRVAILHQPLKAVGVFLVWAIFDSTARAHLFEKPLITLGVLGCLGIMVASMASFRNNDASWSAFKAVLPIIVVYGAGDILARMALPAGQLASRLVVFLAVMSLTSAFVSIILLPWRPKPNLPLLTTDLFRCSLWIALATTISQICFYVALSLGPNPAYVSMVGLLAPVWLLVYHRAMHIPDDASPFAGTVMVIAAIILMMIVA